MTDTGPPAIERRSGVTLWRQIADRMRASVIAQGAPDDRLPPETELATRFGVNRHTVRAAIAALVREGVLRSEQGRGTFIVRRQRVTYPIRQRTRFAEGLAGQAGTRSSIVTASSSESANAEQAGRLRLAPGARLVRLETVSLADGLPVSAATHWFPAERFAALPDAVRASGSVTAGLSACGVDDYLRAETVVEAEHASARDRSALGLAPGAIVLTARAVNVDRAGIPVQYSLTRFAADRVTLSVAHDAPG